MMNVALALMRDVKEEIGRVSDKLDKIAEERREEAREHGGLEVRLTTLEASHKRHVGLVYAILSGLGLLALARYLNIK